MPEESNPAPSEPAITEAKEPKARKQAGKSRIKAEENPTQGEAKEAKPGHSPLAEEEISTGNGKPQEGKRPNRRRRGKGKAQGKDAEKDGKLEPSVEKEEQAEQISEKRGQKEIPVPTAQRPPQTPRRKVDPDKLAKNAWKIYLAEVSEEGVALIGDNDGRELARRCFRLAEIFLEEEDRRS